MSEQENLFTFTEMAKELLESRGPIKGEEKEEYIEDLAISEPEFMKYLQEFLSGQYTLEEGHQDQMLQSISNSLFNGFKLSDKQINSFKARCSKYLDCIRKKEPLCEPEISKREGAEVVQLFRELREDFRHLTKSEKDVVESIAGFFSATV